MDSSSATWKIDVYDGVAEFEPLAWNALVGPASPFLEHGFLATLEETGCVGEAAGWVPRIIIAHEGDELIGALPFYVKSHSSGEFVFDWSWAEGAYRVGIPYYPKAVVAVPFTPVTGLRILTTGTHKDDRELKRSLARAALELAQLEGLSSVHFNFLRAPDIEVLEELGLPIRVGIQYHWQNGLDGAPYAEFADFLARFRSKKRANIRRERRALQATGVTTRVLVGEEVKAHHLRAMFGWYLDTVTKFYYGQQYLNEDFFLALGRKLRERLHLVFIEQDGRPFGGAFNLVKGDRLYGRYWGCDREVEFAHFETCIYRPIEWCIEHGIEVFEPGAGGEHKYERGFAPVLTYSAHHIADPRLRDAITDFVARERVAVEQEVMRLRAESPLKK